MLVLSRKESEQIMIGDEIVVTIVAVRGDKVRVGIDAPQTLPVHRSEIYARVEQEKARSEDRFSGLASSGLSQRCKATEGHSES